MTQTAIQAQIDALKTASANALKTKETALKFLMDAGIIRTEPNHKEPIHAISKDKK